MNLDIARARDGFTSQDFPGISPRTRHGSYIFAPAYSYPDPRMFTPSGYGGFIDTFRPLTLDLIRLGKLMVGARQSQIKGPNQFFVGANPNMVTPGIRKLQTGEISF